MANGAASLDGVWHGMALKSGRASHVGWRAVRRCWRLGASLSQRPAAPARPLYASRRHRLNASCNAHFHRIPSNVTSEKRVGSLLNLFNINHLFSAMEQMCTNDKFVLIPTSPILVYTQVTLVRHGQSTWNKEGRIQGSSDFSVLTDKGEGQAEITRKMLQVLYPISSRRADVADAVCFGCFFVVRAPQLPFHFCAFSLTRHCSRLRAGKPFRCRFPQSASSR